jgi:hypothetical protein
MWYESPIFFAICAAGFWVGKLFDCYTSLHPLWYGLYEANKIFKTKDGDFDLKKNLLFAAAIFGGALVLGLLTSWGAGAAIVIAGGPGFAYVGYHNLSLRKKNRAKQIKVLTYYRENPDGPDLNLGMMVTRNGKSFMSLFPFLALPLPAGQQESIEAVFAEIRRYAREVSPEQWFKY